MALPIQKSSIQDLMLMQNKWSPQLNALLSNPLLKGNQLTNVVLASGSNTINHGLGRAYQGYLITGMHNNFVQIYDTTSPMPSLSLVLDASTSGSIDLYVY